MMLNVFSSVFPGYWRKIKCTEILNKNRAIFTSSNKQPIYLYAASHWSISLRTVDLGRMDLGTITILSQTGFWQNGFRQNVPTWIESSFAPTGFWQNGFCRIASCSSKIQAEWI
jgi:hypothetical protein